MHMASNINTSVILTFAFIPLLLIFQIYPAGLFLIFGCLRMLVSRQLWVNKQSKDLQILCKRNWLNYKMGGGAGEQCAPVIVAPLNKKTRNLGS
jgi:hypothetical protein